MDYKGQASISLLIKYVKELLNIKAIVLTTGEFFLSRDFSMDKKGTTIERKLLVMSCLKLLFSYYSSGR